MTDETAKAITVGSLIDQFYQLREQLRSLEKETKETKALMATISNELLISFDDQGITLCRGRLASASLGETIVPIVDDWDDFSSYIYTNRALHLLERRPMTSAWRELYEGGELVSGTTPFKKRSIHVRTL